MKERIVCLALLIIATTVCYTTLLSPPTESCVETTDIIHNEIDSEIIPLPEPVAETEAPEREKCYSDRDAEMIARLLYSECRGVKSVTQQACVVWTVLNRVDYQGTSISRVITAPGQFAYHEDAPIKPQLLALSYDVLDRWDAEKKGETDVGRVLPKNYRFFYGDGIRNYFKDAYKNANIWDYSLESPYES